MPKNQTSFAAGILDPDLLGRSDFTGYDAGVKDALNFYATPHGALVNRPGFMVVSRLIGSSLGALGKCKLIPFRFSSRAQYILVFSAGKIRFYRSAAVHNQVDYVGITGLQGLDVSLTWQTMIPATIPLEISFFEIDTPYTEDDLPLLKYSQVGNMLAIACRGKAVYELWRLNSTGTSWAFEESTTGLIPFPQWQFPALGHPNRNGQTLLENVYDDYPTWRTGDSSHPPQPWQWAVTRVLKDSRTGRSYETLPYYIDFMRIRLFATILPLLPAEPDVLTHPALIRYRRDLPQNALVTTQPWYSDNPWPLWRPKTVSETNGVSTICANIAGFSPPADQWASLASPNDVGRPVVVHDALPENLPVYPDSPQIIDWRVLYDNLGNPLSGTPMPSGEDELLETRIYRGQQGILGLVGVVNPNLSPLENPHTWVDIGDEPDLSKPPPVGRDPFEILDGDGDVVRQEYPINITHKDGRRVLGGSEERPNFIAESAVDDWTNYEDIIDAVATDAFEFNIDAAQAEEIKNFAEGRHLLALTSTGIRAITALDGSPHPNPENPPATTRVAHGTCGDLQPEILEGALAYTKVGDITPMILLFSPEGASYQPLDRSVISKHLFTKHKIVSWAWQGDPHRVLWVVRDDGAILSFTFYPEERVFAWYRHEIAGDALAESVVTIPEGTETTVYVTALKGNFRWLLRMASRSVSDARKGVFLDFAIVQDLYNTDEAKTLEVQDSAGDVGTSVTVHAEGTTLVVGATYELADPLETQPPGRVVVLSDDGGGDYTTEVVATIPTGALLTPLTEWAPCAGSIYGLTDVGATVTVVADGNVLTDVPVVAGVATIPNGDLAAIAIAGLPYNCDAEFLPASLDDIRAKITRKVFLRLASSRGAVKVGQTFSGLTETRAREVGDGFGTIPIRNRTYPVNVKGKWDQDGSVVLRVDSPIPVSVVGVLRDVKVGGEE